MLPDTLIVFLEEAKAHQAEKKKKQQEKIKTIIEKLKLHSSKKVEE